MNNDATETTMNEIDLDSVLGLTEGDAVAKLKAAGLKVRVVGRNGVPFAHTMDYWRDRVNLVIADDKVTKASIG